MQFASTYLLSSRVLHQNSSGVRIAPHLLVVCVDINSVSYSGSGTEGFVQKQMKHPMSLGQGPSVLLVGLSAITLPSLGGNLSTPSQATAQLCTLSSKLMKHSTFGPHLER